MIPFSITLKNLEINRILNHVSTLDYINDGESFAKGYENITYHLACKYATSDQTLINHLKHNEPIKKIKYNKILSNTEAGKFFETSIYPLLKYDRFYSSGYIPKGFDRWHNDSDVTGYALLFSYATDTNGYFKYRDPFNDSIVTIQDTKGWSIKGAYYSDDPITALWHCVATMSVRMTFILMFDSQNKYNIALGKLLQE